MPCDMRDFLTAVGEQIGWKRARQPVLKELETHILDRRDDLMDAGIDAEQAERQAVAEMGDPEEIGLELNMVHRPRPNWGLIGCCAAMVILGLFLQWSVGDRQEYFARMLFYSVAGTAALIAGYFMDYTMLAKLPTYMFFAVSALIVLLQIPGDYYLSVLGAQLCYILPMIFAVVVYRERKGSRKQTVTVLLALIVCYIATIISTRWTSLLLYYPVPLFAIAVFAFRKKWYGRGIRYILAAAAGLPIIGFLLMYLHSGELLKRRLFAAYAAKSDPHGYGWTPMRLREIIDGVQLFGRGESSRELELFLFPNQLTSVEFTLATASHKYGYAVFILLIVLTAVIAYLLIRGYAKQGCSFGRLVVLTVGICFLVRTVCYFASNLGLIMLSLEGMPLFSYSGKMMVFDMFAAGIVLSVFRNQSIARDILPVRK